MLHKSVAAQSSDNLMNILQIKDESYKDQKQLESVIANAIEVAKKKVDSVDVLVPTPYPLQPGAVIRCRPVGVLKMTDESGEDAKLVAVPHSKLSKEYDNIKDVDDLPELLKAQIKHFFEHYKDLEAGKWVKVDGWENAESARKEIIESFERAKK